MTPSPVNPSTSTTPMAGAFMPNRPILKWDPILTDIKREFATLADGGSAAIVGTCAAHRIFEVSKLIEQELKLKDVFIKYVTGRDVPDWLWAAAYSGTIMETAPANPTEAENFNKAKAALNTVIMNLQSGRTLSYPDLVRIADFHKVDSQYWYYVNRSLGHTVVESPDPRIQCKIGLPETTLRINTHGADPVGVQIVVQDGLNNCYPSRNHWVTDSSSGKTLTDRLEDFGKFREARKMPIRNFQIAFELLNPEKEVLGAVGNGNLLSNSGIVAFINGDFLRCNNEKWEDTTYTCFATLKSKSEQSASLSFVDVKFHKEADGSFKVLDLSGKDITKEIDSLISTPALIQAGKAVNLSDFASSIEDVRHALLLPHQGRKYYLGLEQLSNNPALVKKALNGAIELDIDSKVINHQKLEEILAAEGYVNAGNPAKPGEYCIADDHEKISIFLRPGVYPHNFIGIDGKGELVVFQVRGVSSGDGTTFEEAQKKGLSLGLSSMGLLDNGGDVMLQLGRGFVVPSSKFRSNLSAAILFTRERWAPQLSEAQKVELLKEYVTAPSSLKDLSGKLTAEVDNLAQEILSSDEKLRLFLSNINKLIADPAKRESHNLSLLLSERF